MPAGVAVLQGRAWQVAVGSGDAGAGATPLPGILFSFRRNASSVPESRGSAFADITLAGIRPAAHGQTVKPM